ncbi:ubiquitin-like protein ISG15 [Antechinus flavipes]|uniref:ubiquitin-like protein ISG15 n=1 Tax=Antechinus flavipes TaxID=38775 RepID=UPI0022362ADA|nr:ubiquitin-like protein ISG15 [Antechinus flavipes]
MILNLRVKMMTGREFSVKVEDSLTVLELKKRLARQVGTPAHTQKLATESGEVLLNWKRLSEHRLRPDSLLLLLVLEQDQPMDVLVRTDSGTSPYRILLSQTVAQLKKLVQEKEQVNTSMFWLIFQDQRMEDKDYLGDYGLSPLCTIQMNLRLRGGLGQGVL